MLPVPPQPGIAAPNPRLQVLPPPIAPAYRTAGPLPVPIPAPQKFVPTGVTSPRPRPIITSPRTTATSPRTGVVPPPPVVAIPRPTITSPRTTVTSGVVPPPPRPTITSPRTTATRTGVVPPPPVVAIPRPTITSPRTTATSPRTTTVVIPPPPVVAPLRAEIVREELVLRPRQVPWANKAHDILMQAHGVIDTSLMGSGKTFTTLWQAKQLNLPILVISLTTLENMWRTMSIKYGVRLIDFVSYQSLRSMTGHQPKHGYLTRVDEFTEGNKKFLSFRPTQLYLDLVRDGLMVICDEIDKIKNNSDQYRATAAMIHPVIAPDSISRFMLLSAIPFDKEEHSINLLRLIGYIRHPRLYTYVGKPPHMRLEGIQELVDAANFIDADGTRTVLAQVPLMKSTVKALVFRLYSEVILNRIAGSMPPPDINTLFDAKNGFYNIHPARLKQLVDGIALLASAVGYHEGDAEVQIKAENIGDHKRALVQIENAKSDDMARVAHSILVNYPTSKVVICVNYVTTLEALRNTLAPYNPLILYGDIPPNRRQPIVDSFNNDFERRVLIMNTAVGGHGISLHDTVGDAPRYMLLSPSYNLLEIAQATGRIYRDGTLSDATVRMFYGKGRGAQETKILNAMARKSHTAKGSVAGPAKDALVLPGDYASEIEE